MTLTGLLLDWLSREGRVWTFPGSIIGFLATAIFASGIWGVTDQQVARQGMALYTVIQDPSSFQTWPEHYRFELLEAYTTPRGRPIYKANLIVPAKRWKATAGRDLPQSARAFSGQELEWVKIPHEILLTPGSIRSSIGKIRPANREPARLIETEDPWPAGGTGAQFAATWPGDQVMAKVATDIQFQRALILVAFGGMVLAGWGGTSRRHYAGLALALGATGLAFARIETLALILAG